MTTEKPKTLLYRDEKGTLKLNQSVFMNIPKEKRVMPYRFDSKKGESYYIVDEKTLRERIKNGNRLDNVCTSLVTDMSSMFFHSRKFNQDISSWDTSNVENMQKMFNQANEFNQNIGSWDTSKVKNMLGMFWGASLFDKDIGRWDTRNVENMEKMFYNAVTFNKDISKWKTENVTTMKKMFNDAQKFDQDIGRWDTKNVENMEGMFWDAYDFNQNIGEWKTSKVTDMSSMFSHSRKFNQDISSWDTSKVTTMDNMFYNAETFNQDIRKWNKSKLKSRENMFFRTDALKEEFKHWTLYEQKIFFGAPGTGKSYKVDEDINRKGSEKRMKRVTFHSEFDYASFVGGYKPTMGNKDGEDVIRYEFVPQVFTNIYIEAWKDRENDYYLVIEEINRGNCAAIFGDIFQLLDREYDVTPSSELHDFLKKEGCGEKSGLEKGKIRLPKNLTIYATMNTSDQSLFPMDSAFKRRWDWEYIPICYEKNKDYTVNLGDGGSFSWIDFIKKVNIEHIQKDKVLGMDKCIGHHFIKPKEEKKIDIESFIYKVIFYLWNHVFKDVDNKVFGNIGTYEDFFPIKKEGVENITKVLKNIRVEIKPEIKKSEIKPENDDMPF